MHELKHHTNTTGLQQEKESCRQPPLSPAFCFPYSTPSALRSASTGADLHIFFIKVCPAFKTFSSETLCTDHFAVVDERTALFPNSLQPCSPNVINYVATLSHINIQHFPHCDVTNIVQSGVTQPTILMFPPPPCVFPGVGLCRLFSCLQFSVSPVHRPVLPRGSKTLITAVGSPSPQVSWVPAAFCPTPTGWLPKPQSKPSDENSPAAS